MVKEAQILLENLYESVKKWARLKDEIRSDENLSKKRIDILNSSSGLSSNDSESDDHTVQLILSKTLSMLCLINLSLKNLPLAKKSLEDLELISPEDSTTFTLKIKLLILDPSPSPSEPLCQ